MNKAVFPGSFDPPTHGHLNIIQRISRIFDEIEVVIAVNPSKNYLFSPEERFHMMKELVKEYGNVNVFLWDKLVVAFPEKTGASIMIRGVRALDDFDHEFEISMINKTLNQDIETLLIPTDPKYFVLRSSAIKEIALFGGDISTMVPKIVADALKEKIGLVDKHIKLG